MKDEQVIANIQNGGKQRESALAFLFREKQYYLFTQKYVTFIGGNTQDVEDIYTEAISILDRVIREDKFQKKSTIYSFYCGVVKNIARKNIGKYAKEESFEHNSSVFTYEFDYINDFNQKKAENSVIVSEILALIDDKCKNIIRLVALGYSNEDIQDELKFPSIAAARMALSRCRENTRQKITQNNYFKTLIDNLKLNLNKND